MPKYLADLAASEHKEDFKMNEISVLIGGKAGDGINSAGAMVAQLLNHLGYRIYLYFDYPSLIRGGHNFAIIRGSEHDVGACRNHVDFILALNEDTIERHKEKCMQKTVIISNKDLVKNGAYGIPVKGILAKKKRSRHYGQFGTPRGICKSCRDRVGRS
jgi:2-oxoglutarate ferredoxin oxidoreductase subunit alpha